MARPKTYRCEAVVLGYTPLGEADILVTLFTETAAKYAQWAKVRGVPTASWWGT